MQPWVIKPLWGGKTVFILGGGPSLKDEDLSLIHNQRVIGVNDAFKLGSWVDLCWWSDCRWAIWNHEVLSQYTGIILSCVRCHCQHPHTLTVSRLEGSGISERPDGVKWNRSSGGSAINVAYLLGSKKIVLLGYDMKVVDGQHNWHTNHKFRPKDTIYNNRFIPPFLEIAKDATRLGIEILNATKNSALDMFPKVDLKEVVNGSCY
jgi:hypothetical protein